jgi:Na+-driven multidrug efflux pump
MKEAMKEDIKDFVKVYSPMVVFMLLLAGLEAIDGHASGAAACAGIAVIFAIMYILTVIMSAVIELVEVVKR